MIYGFYNTNPFTPASLAVVLKGDVDDHKIIYPDGHSEPLTDNELNELKPDFIKVRKSKIWKLSPLETKFVLLPNGKIIAGDNIFICSYLIKWYKNESNIDNETTKTITGRYISFLLEKIADENSVKLNKKAVKLFSWFSQVAGNVQLEAFFNNKLLDLDLSIVKIDIGNFAKVNFLKKLYEPNQGSFNIELNQASEDQTPYGLSENEEAPTE
jgi:hypothetical protein